MLTELQYHHFLPLLQQTRVCRCLVLLVQVLKEFRKYVQKLWLQQKVPHCLSQSVVSPRRQQHMIHLFPPQGMQGTVNEHHHQTDAFSKLHTWISVKVIAQTEEQ